MEMEHLEVLGFLSLQLAVWRADKGPWDYLVILRDRLGIGRIVTAREIGTESVTATVITTERGTEIEIGTEKGIELETARSENVNVNEGRELNEKEKEIVKPTKIVKKNFNFSDISR
jgi:hypothetical protein